MKYTLFLNEVTPIPKCRKGIYGFMEMSISSQEERDENEEYQAIRLCEARWKDGLELSKHATHMTVNDVYFK